MRIPRLLLALAAVKLLAHAPAMTQYGYFRDELYYLASTQHPDFGYVDHAPLSILLLALIRAALGDSLVALRIVPALAGAAMVVIAGLMARDLGGGRFAQALAALTVIVAPVYLGVQHTYSMNCFDQLLWTLAAWILVRILTTEGSRPWPALGVVLGLGLLNKISMLWMGMGLAAGLLLTRHRRLLATPGPWLAGGIAALLFSPYVVWQILHGWPTLEFMRNATEQKMVSVGLREFAGNQILVMNPATAPVWIAGLVWCLASRAGRDARILGIVFLTAAAILVATGTSRASYLAPAYPMLLAPGARCVERLTQGARARRLRAPIVAVLALSGLVLAPLALPVLPPDTFLVYMRTLGVTPPAEERSARAELPQHYADMFGWDEMAEKVARAYRSLPAGEQARCAFFGQNYGEAGALEVLGPRHGLPAGRTMSGHNSYWLWGPRGDGDVMIVLGGDREDNARVFDQLVLVDTIVCERCMPYERNLEVWVGRGMRRPLSDLWPDLRMFI